MKKRVRDIGWLLLAATLASGATWLFHPRVPAWRLVESAAASGRWSITAGELAALPRAAEVVWVDTRAAAEYEQGHAPDAILLDPERLGETIYQNMDALQDAMDRPVVVYGSDSGRIHRVAEQLRDLLGLEPVYVLEGSWH